MSRIDLWIESFTRGLAHRGSRRGFLTVVGGVLFGSAGLPLLPVARAAERRASPGRTSPS